MLADDAQTAEVIAYLVRLRRRRGLSRSTVADRMGLAPAVVDAIEERGGGRVSLLRAYAGALGARLTWTVEIDEQGWWR